MHCRTSAIGVSSSASKSSSIGNGHTRSPLCRPASSSAACHSGRFVKTPLKRSVSAVNACARQRREIDDEIGLVARCERKRIGKRHASFCVAVHDLNRDAVRRGDDFLRPIGARADVVLGDREPAIDVEWRIELIEREQRSQRHGAALHVLVHEVHALVRLQIDAAGIEANSFADERDVARVPCCDRARVDGCARCRRSRDRSHAQPREMHRLAAAAERRVFKNVKCHRCSFREPAQRAAICRTVEHIRRQGRQPARDMIAMSRLRACVATSNCRFRQPQSVIASRAVTAVRLRLESGQRCRSGKRGCSKAFEHMPRACDSSLFSAVINTRRGDSFASSFHARASEAQQLERGSCLRKRNHDSGIACGPTCVLNRLTGERLRSCFV